MARKIIDIGTLGNDGTGDSIRDSFRKVNDNFRELYSSLGLGDNLRFISLDDTPDTYIGNENAILSVGEDVTAEEGLAVKFKQLVGGRGIGVDFIGNEIRVTSLFSEIVNDPAPQLGGDLNVRSGGITHKIFNLDTPTEASEATNKNYVDTKLSLDGVSAFDPEIGRINSAFGTMKGPLILSRDPVAEDDEIYDGLIAATKRYVDNASFGSVANLYVAKSGQDDRVGIDRNLQGRALAYAYRTIEAACKRAEELMLQSRFDIGPYRKLLTYNNGANTCTLADVAVSPISGTGFAASARMSIDSVELNTPGANYNVGDIISISVPSGGTGSAATFEVLSTTTTPGQVVTFRQISSGVYEGALPGSVAVTTNTDSVSGNGVTFNITYKVNNVRIKTIVDDGVDGRGSGYSLVSVRIEGGGAVEPAFGTAVVDAGKIESIFITDDGAGFTSIPTVSADLPRFFIETGGQRTDFTGDVTTDTPIAFRGRDIREGLYLQGVESGALAQIVGHQGDLDSRGYEIFDVDIKFGSFRTGEPVAYGDITKINQISILIESGVYEENLPIKVPQNVAIIGDEFRRVIIRPKQGVSSSPWAFQNFRRDLLIGEGSATRSSFDPNTGRWEYTDVTGDLIPIADQIYGYHYLNDSRDPVYPRIDNKGGYNSAAALLDLNREFLQEEVIAWNRYQIENNIAPFTDTFEYNENLCKRDVGLIVDSIAFDIRYGEYNRTISAGLKYYENASALIAITTQLSETLASVDYLNVLLLNVISNTQTTTLYQTVFPQIVDGAYISESGADAVINDLITALKDIMDESGPGYGSVNQPKNNEEMDMFLLNDATILRAITGQGHGGFMCVLDPEGQVLAKSPYIQESASFSRSKDAQVFAGGMFVDGFAGNLQFKHVSTSSPFRISVEGLLRLPQLPASFIVNDQVHRVNYVRDYVFNTSGSTATFIIDETTPFSLPPGEQTCTISIGNPAVITKSLHRLQANATIVFSSTGSLPTGIVAGREYYVSGDSLTNDTFSITELPSSTTLVQTSGTQTGTQKYQRIYELLMPGNRSLLCNDYTQVNDLGYGIVATNGGLVEAVSMFTYYCHISYYSVNGGQIRSVGGSSSHGNYALVAQGADPLEVPTPTTLYQDLAQRVDCYAPVGTEFENIINGLFIYVTNYDYVPLGGSELEIDHGNIIYRYPVTSVATNDLPAGVARLNITSDETGNFEGLFAAVSDGTKMSLRSNSKVLLTDELAEVATRPSTGLILAENAGEVYRVLQFEIDEDVNGPYEVQFSIANPSVLNLLMTVTTINSNVCTTSQNHRLKIGDVFIPTSSSNNFVSGDTYYVIDVPNYNQFIVSTTAGGTAFVLSNGTGLTIKGKVSHKLLENYRLSFRSTGTLPTGVDPIVTHYVVLSGLTETDFRVSLDRGGIPIAVTGAGSGTHSFNVPGLTKTTLRENYNYVDLTLFAPGEFVTPGGDGTCTFTLGTPGIVNTSGAHGLSQGDVIKITVTPGGSFPGFSSTRNYFVFDPDPDSVGAGSTKFTISAGWPATPGTVETTFSGSSSGTFTWGLVTGRAGDDNFAVVAVAPQERSRVTGSRFMFLGEEYVIDQYESEDDLNEAYARITLNRPLEDSMIEYSSMYSIKSAVSARTPGSRGNLTIRISLTRVTSHDLLEIGTGSYADTNYPKEIYGASVNPLNPSAETEERDVGRVFYVTTDQFGNFSVGPYFKVDQGTGAVTFAASIALSNLDGIGFKRGVPVSEFSTDSAMSDNAVDTVPTENAVRIYIERRLGLTHGGDPVASPQLIPTITGGFMALDGQLAMKADMNLGDNKIELLADPINPQDAVNLRSLNFGNVQGFDLTNIQANDLIVFTGVGVDAINAEVVGDIALNIDSTANTVDAQINPDVILNADVNSAAGIEQSKLLLNRAGTLASSAGLFGDPDEDDGQASRGSVVFDSDSFAEEIQLTFSVAVTLNAGEVVYQGAGTAGPRGIVSASVTSSQTVVVRTTSTFAVALTPMYKAVYSSAGVEQTSTVITGAAITAVKKSGFIDLKDRGITISKLAQMPQNTVIGRKTGSTGDVEQVAFSDVVNQGSAIKKNQYDVEGVLVRINPSSNTADADYDVVAVKEAYTGAGDNSSIVKRNASGNIEAAGADFDSLSIDSELALDSYAHASGTALRLYNHGGNGGIRLQNSSLTSDRITYYDNNLHIFRSETGLSSSGEIQSNTVRTLNLTTGLSTTAGTITGRWTLTGTAPSESRLQATYSADLAEYYEGDIEYEVGTVLVFGGEKEVTISGTKGDRRVAGVVSNTAAFAMYEGCPGKKNLVALQGRVPVKVVGKVEKGDILVTSDVSGVACVDNDPKPGTIIGKALENYDSNQVGKIEAAVGRN